MSWLHGGLKSLLRKLGERQDPTKIMPKRLFSESVVAPWNSLLKILRAAPTMKAKNRDHDSVITDLRIVPSGSGGAILYLDWFLNSCDNKLDRQASEIKRNYDMIGYCKH